MSRIIDLSPYCQYFWRSLEKLFRNKQLNFHMITTFSININLASEIAIQQTYFYHSSMTNFERFWQWNVYWHDSDWPAKAFDTINHKILLNKLLPIGFSKNSISWYESYLAECHFTVEIADQVSKFSNISCGVSQGSILGPLLLWYEPSCRMGLVLICRWFIHALLA